MEVQNPFQIAWDKTPYATFADYVFSKVSAHGSHLAIVDADTGKQWRFSEIRMWSEMCMSRLKELGVTLSSKVALVTGTTGQAIFVQLACSMIGCPAVCVNGWGTVDEIWQLVDLSEATHLVADVQFLQKAEDVRRKAQMRGGGRIKTVRSIDDVLSSDMINEKSEPIVPGVPKDKRNLGSLNRELSSSRIATSVVTDEECCDLPSPLSDSAPRTLYQYGSATENGSENLSDFTAPGNALCTPSQQPTLIFFTSGTTGLPKAAEVSRRSLIINLQQLSCPIFGPLQPKERLLLPLSMAHIFGVISAYYALVNGACIVTESKFSVKQAVELVLEHRINAMHLTPPMLQAFAYDSLADANSFQTVRSVIVGGAPLDANIASLCKKKMNLRDLRQTYGMTELGGLCTLSHIECGKMESVGVPLPGMLFKIVQIEGKQLAQPHQIGQLLVMGPQAMPSYYKNPKATSDILDAQGFIKTGDAAFYDENGYVYVLDRVKDIIKYRGTLVCPSEVELVLRAHPGIDDCAVVGRQDHVAGEVSPQPFSRALIGGVSKRAHFLLPGDDYKLHKPEQVPAAFVVKSSTHPLLSSAEVRQYVSGKIATFKELRGGVFFISEIPRSVCGKILRRQLRQFWDRERTNSKVETLSTAVKDQKVVIDRKGRDSKSSSYGRNRSRPSSSGRKK